ncbi:MAG: NAD-dependent epimerase/dehydratase family protein [archaeon]
MKILVTGGCGFIGSHIIDELVKNKHDVVVLDNLSTGSKKYLNPKAKFYEADIREDISDIFLKEKPEIVIHTAAQVMLRKSIEEPIEDAKINIFGTINVLEACKKSKVRKIIYTSTGGARYGEPKYLPVDENHPIHPLSPYGISKHTAEHYIESYSNLYGIEYLIVGFGNVYGPRDDPAFKRVICLFAMQILNGETPKIFGDGEQVRDFIFVKDIADFIASCIDKKPEHKLFNLANGEKVTVNQIYSMLKEVSGFAKDAEHINAIKGEVREIQLDTTLAKKELGWTPKTKLIDGIKETFEWLKENRKK